ncbi:hypothetical protein N0V90_008535 [Kalmusia sp. IMI 367209]|nr:hypothetical protein N0V90_008535 [Kalmusia sp. IMI 367209]
MEPRIATLLGHSSLDRPPLHTLPSIQPSTAPRRLHPVEPSTTHDDTRANPTSSSSSLLDQSHHQQSPNQPKRQKPSAPIASVLNRETPAATTIQPVPAAAVTPFSGRLSDLLLDPSQQHSNKRKRADEPIDSPAHTITEKPLLKLPKLPQQPKKSTKRPRIPPLLQGLHQPPAFAQGRLYPPITSDSGAFGRDIADGVALRNIGGYEQRRENEKDALPDAGPEKYTSGALGEPRVEERVGTIPTSTSDQENASRTEQSTPPVGATVTKGFKKRNKWSDQETKDLLVGVSRFGIGSWKKILQCPDFTFHQRTAVDLKDRFRTCFPGEGVKPRNSKRKGGTADNNSQRTAASSTSLKIPSHQDLVVQETVREINMSQVQRGEQREEPADSPNTYIHGVFAKSNRRERRAFTEKDDENLLKGFEKYTSQWLLMRDDEELGFSGRRPTDLRDRFRIRYPEVFVKLGYKIKPKDELKLKEKEKGREKETSITQDSTRSMDSEGSPHSSRTKDSTADTSFSSLNSTAPSNPNLMPLALRESFLTSFTGPLEDFGDLASEEDGDNSHSPIILNRNIFEWADANPTNMTSVSTAGLPSMSTLASDAPLTVLNGTDGMHINPMVTLNMPMALLNSNVLSLTPPHPSAPGHQASSRLPEPFQHTNTALGTTTSATSAAMNTTTPSTKQSTNHLLRTPNLPTIVFPPVPASSARSAVHNLPPPSDLLSGLEIDPRLDTQAATFPFDDGFGLSFPQGTGAGYASGATLAPMVNTGAGRAMLTLEKGLLEEVGERRV